MFTGLIEEIGHISHVTSKGEAMLLTVQASKVLEEVKLGDSISVNGVCLTVTSFNSSSFTADVMPETYRRSSLSSLKKGGAVNLERAMQIGSRFGGHIVQGHVDGLATIKSSYEDSNAVVYTLQLHDREQLRYIIPKGSITIDGISLTVVDVAEEAVTVSIIPHTLAQTALQYRKPGEIVNIECDIIGKYVEHLLGFQAREAGKQSKLSAAFLQEHGFM
ncbi:riboflavin synthase subunit alpha [Paenibacillus montaniterrae]|uniref:Riboflavin synthase n=1 Tax=Paenibacillus montaniterrae TaxID=429341 RepID=A0A919YL04_9BACL|nr:riboflavin synthase [Paenibacillus montaniterrae]GIP15192.1 riboflavin synthase subunit alpha [Paenibacillus montaniterrae]